MQLKGIKIICTIGPASDSDKVLKSMISSRVDVFRLNLSHNSLSYHLDLINRIRKLYPKDRQQPAILVDLPGPKFRIGKLKEDKLQISAGKEYSIGGENSDIPVESSIINQLSTKYPVLLSDGKIKLKILRRLDDKIIAKAMNSFTLLSRQSISQKGLSYHGKYPIEEDVKLIKEMLKAGIDIFGLSFVSDANDINNVRKLVGDAVIVAKIERQEAVNNFESIAKSADVIMIARGDLGLNMNISDVPVLQRRLIKKAHELNKPAIVATQILESMTNETMPTRAEADDIFTAVTEGADALMLSEETAIGKYPLLALRTLKNLSDVFSKIIITDKYTIKDENDAVVDSAVELINKTGIKHVVVLTEGGTSAFRLSRYNLGIKIIAITNSKVTMDRLRFGRNITPFLFKDLNEGFIDVKKELINQGIDKVVLISGKFGVKDSTTKVEIINLKSDEF